MSNVVYISMVACTFMSALTHVLAIKTLPIAQDIPLWVNYLIHISYLIFYDFQGILFLMYVIAVTKRNKVNLANRVFLQIFAGIEILLLATTPFTKLIIYFDEDMQYRHGPLFGIYFVFAVLILTYASVIFVNYRRKLNALQRASIVLFEVLMLGAVMLQLYFKSLVIGNFAASLALVIMLVVLQNPDDFTDKASGCFNHDAFYLSVEYKMNQKSKFTVVAFRFDGMNYISGLFRVGDRNSVPKAIARRLKSEFGTAEIYHFGGCEFAMFTNEKRRHTEDYITERLQKYFSHPVTIGDVEAVLTPRICVIHCPELAASPEEVRDAIEYTLRASNKAEGSVFVATAESISAKKRELQILTSIKKFIVNKGFEMFYQPIYSAEERGFVSAEALIRMNDSELGFVSPEEFIPLAESNGMIMEVGEIAFRKVCEFMKSGRAQAMGVKYIEVNLSAIQCVQEQLSDELAAIMKEYGIPPEQINFEITETAGLENFDALLKNMNALIAMGSSFSMDDYGTGFSTANYLISLPMDIVKIDKSILWPAMKSNEAYVILCHTVEMLKSLKKKIVVEGVETEEMARLLIKMGCDYLQGYYYQKPVPGEEYLRFLEKNQKM